MPHVFWWIRQIVLVLAAVFFAFFGIQVLISAYKVNDPFSFIMIFFASNLIILISLALLVGFCIQIWKVIKNDQDNK